MPNSSAKGGSAFGGKFQLLNSCLIIASVVLLSPAIVSAQDVTSGLIGHWKFDEGAGTIAADSSGSNNVGSLTKNIDTRVL